MKLHTTGICIVIYLLAAVSCSKNTGTVEDPKTVTLRLQVKTIDNLRLQFAAGDNILTQSVITPDGHSDITFEYTEPVYRFSLYDMFGHRTMADTQLSISTVRTMSKMVFFQQAPGGKLVWIGPPPPGEAPAPADSIKMSIIYTHPDLPATAKVVVENSIGNTNSFSATDSFLLDKGEFSRYFTANPTTGGKKLQLKFYTPDINRRLIGSISNAFSILKAKFYVFAFRSGSLSNGIYTLNAENLY